MTGALAAGMAVQPSRVGCQHCWRTAAVRQSRACWLGRRNLTCSAAGADNSPPGGDSPSSAIPDSLPVVGLDSDWRAFRAQLVASAAAGNEGSVPAAGAAAVSTPDTAWAHSLPRPEQGCLLLANPLMFGSSQTYFYMSVILIFGHDERGSAGLILNRPTEYTVGQLGAGAAALQPEFNACQLYLGGDVGEESVHLVHNIHGLRGSVEIIPGVQLGGFEEAKRGLAEGRFSPDQFKVLTRYAGWGPGQLESECQRGVWLPVSASKHVLLRETTKGMSVADMWHYVAQLAGGDLAHLSREVLGVADPEIQRAAAAGGSHEQQEEAGEQQQQQQGALGSPDDSDVSQQGMQARWQWRQQQQRRRAPEADYRDGAGI